MAKFILWLVSVALMSAYSWPRLLGLHGLEWSIIAGACSVFGSVPAGYMAGIFLGQQIVRLIERKRAPETTAPATYRTQAPVQDDEPCSDGDRITPGMIFAASVAIVGTTSPRNGCPDPTCD